MSALTLSCATAWLDVAEAQEPPPAAPPAAQPVPPAAPAPAPAAPPVEAAPAPAPAEPAPAPAPPPEAAPMQEVAPTDAPAPAVEAAPPPVAEDVAPPDEEGDADFEKKFNIGAGLRTGLDFKFAGDDIDDPQLSLSDGLADQVNIRPFMGGNLTPELGYFIQFEIGTPNGLGSFAILDGIAQIKFVDEFQLWVGQHIPASDRSNMNGPFFINTWNFPLTWPTYPFDTGGRDRGATFWGLVADGLLKYHLSAVDLQPGQEVGNARYGARVVLNFLEPENYYYNSGTYWGEQDTLAIGATVQHQNGVEPPADPADDDNDFTMFSFDAFFEKNLGDSGTITIEGGYANLENRGSGYVVNQGTVDSTLGVIGSPSAGQSFMGILSWLTPDEVGIGKIQPNARFQYGDYDTATISTLDLGLAYVIDGFNHKYHLNYRFNNMEPAGAESVAEHSIQLGAQFQLSN